MRALASVLLVLTVGLLACDNEGLVVRVEGLSPDISALRVRFLRDGQAVGPDREITRTLQQFVVTGVEGGDYQLDIAGLGSDRCIVARQSQSVSYRGGSLRPTDVSVRLSSDPAKPCPIRITVDDSVTVTSTPKGIACGKDAAGQPLRDCVVDMPRGSELSLQGQTKDGFATYPALSGLCLAIDSCNFRVEKAGEVRAVATKRVCNKDGWCVQNPMPQPHTFTALWGFAADDIWAVGLRGTVLHYDGRAWTSMDAGVTTDFYAVWGATPGDVWVVGDRDGLTPPISHYQQGKWETVSGNGDLRSIYGSAGNNIWAFGNSGFAMHYDGANWKESIVSLAGSKDPIAAHWLDNEGNGWMIDRSGNAAILEKNTWTAISQQLLRDIYSIRGADNVIWAAGYYGIAHTSGKSKWQTDILPKEAGTSPGLYSVFPISQADVWAVGDRGLILHWDGKDWSIQASGTKSNLLAIWGANANDIWAVGGTGVMLHWDGKHWSQYSHDATAGQGIWKTWGASASDVWAVGMQGTIVHWDGYRWQLNTMNQYGALNAIWGNSKDNIWAVGENGLTLKYSGSDWKLIPPITTAAISGVWIGEDSNGWAVTQKSILRLQDGIWKSELDLPSMMPSSLSTVWGSSSKNVFAVGPNASYRYSNNWESDASTYNLVSLWGVPGSGPWATEIGRRTYVMKFSATSKSWNTSLSDLGEGAFWGIWGRGLDDVTVLGSQIRSGIFQLRNGKWAQTYQSNIHLSSVWGTADGHMWAVGHGAILHQGPPGSRPSPSP